MIPIGMRNEEEERNGMIADGRTAEIKSGWKRIGRRIRRGKMRSEKMRIENPHTETGHTTPPQIGTVTESSSYNDHDP